MLLWTGLVVAVTAWPHVNPKRDAPPPPFSMLSGVDYYPEQWPTADMAADMHSIKHDLQADTVRIGEFMWTSLEPREGTFDFAALDAVMDAADAVGLNVILGTPTATFPSWLARNYPEVMTRLPAADDGRGAGAVPGFGGRRQYSFHSATYRALACNITEQLAVRYGQRVHAWQIDNEIGHELSDLDFSDNAAAAWGPFLERAYGNVSALNEAWGTVFWGATYAGFDEVPLPVFTLPGKAGAPLAEFRANQPPGMLLDYRRFQSEAIAAFVLAQAAILRTHSPASLTTNSPGGLWAKAMDSNSFFKQLDFASYDNYPVWGGSLEPVSPATTGLAADHIRGLGPYNRTTHSFAPFTVMEQLIGAQGHDVIGYTPRPQQAVAWSAQMLAHGAAGLLFFRYRAAVFGQEEASARASSGESAELTLTSLPAR